MASHKSMEEVFQTFKDLPFSAKMYILEKFRVHQMERELQRYLEPMPEWDDDLYVCQYKSKRQVLLDSRFQEETPAEDLLFSCAE